MDKCLPVVKQSQAEVLILLSEKNIDNEMSTNVNSNTSINDFYCMNSNLTICYLYLFFFKFLNGVERIILN